MKQSWGPRLLILGMVVLVEGESPVSGWVGSGMGFTSHPLPQQPLQVCEGSLPVG